VTNGEGCWWGNRQAKRLLEELGVDDMLIFEVYIEEMGWQVVGGIIWLRIKSGDESCEQKVFNFGFRKMWKVYSLAENVAVNFSRIVIHRFNSNSNSSSSSSSNSAVTPVLINLPRFSSQ
jgi:hypothetical protein